MSTMAAYVVTSLLSHVLPITTLLICSQVSTFVVSSIITCKTAQTEKKSNAILIKYQCNTNKILKSTALEYFISVALNAILMQYYRAIYRLVLHWYCIETYYVRSILLVLHLSDKLQIVLH